MKRETNTYFIDFRFLEHHKEINESNILEYMRAHPEYDPTSVTEKKF